MADVPPGDEEGEDGDVPGSIDLDENRNNVRDGNGSEKVGQNTLTCEELRQKLRKKIEYLRGNRVFAWESGVGADNDGNRSFRKGKGDNGDKSKKEKKRKRDGEGSSGKDDISGENEGEEIIEYGKVKIGDDEMEGKKRKKKKMSKAKELGRVRRWEEVKRENPRAAEMEWWRAAENRAMGVKVHDDPKLLRESMKKEKNAE